MAMGPNAVGDLAGLDVGYRVRRERKDLPDDPRYYRVADLLVEAGRLGQKTGRGAYSYHQGSAQAGSRSRGRIADRRRVGAARHRAPRDRGRGDPRALPVCADQRRSARSLCEGIAACPRRHRRDLVQRLRISAPSRRTHVLRRHARCGHRAGRASTGFGTRIGPQYWTPAPLLEELAAAWRRRSKPGRRAARRAAHEARELRVGAMARGRRARRGDARRHAPGNSSLKRPPPGIDFAAAAVPCPRAAAARRCAC